MRQLASIQKIHSIQPIEGRDRVEQAKVLEWPVIIGKGIYNEGDLVCFFEIDSVLPQIPEFEDMAKTKYRVKTFKVNGQDGPIYGQGYCIPFDLFKKIVDTHTSFWDDLEEVGYEGSQVIWQAGQDVTDLLKVTKYEPPVNETKFKSGDSKGDFPSHIIPKTDETRLEACASILDEIKGQPYVITLKYDGTSATYLNIDGKVVACSRNMMLKSLEESGKPSVYYEMMDMYPGIKRMLEENPNLAVQGEIFGEGIQKNPFGIKGKDFRAFNVYYVNDRKYADYLDALAWCNRYGIPVVGEIERGESFKYAYDEICKLSEVTYEPSGKVGEGIVIRPMKEQRSRVLKGERMSFKKINPAFLVKAD
jgi:RNA ligase (TIGR02306 family)